MNIPQHIAIIMDGNGRWARKRGLPKIMGHAKGVDALKDIVKACKKFGVKCLTVYAFSTENWFRPESEIKALFGILEKFLDNETCLFHENKVRFYAIGDRDRIDRRLMARIEKFEDETKSYSDLILNVALSYGARSEIINAVKLLLKDVRDGVIGPDNIDEGIFSKYLYTRHCPDPDLLIRTSGEMRISNFLLWQLSYAEIYVTPKLWPDFGEQDLKKAIEEFSRRSRRFGK